MIIPQDLQRDARLTLEKRRQAAQTQADLRREEIYAKIPLLVHLDEKIGAAGAAAARYALDGERDKADSKLAELNDLKLRRRLLLTQNNLSEKDLAPAYTCTMCNDTGRQKDGAACDCLKKELLALRRQAVNRAGHLQPCRFESFLVDRYPDTSENGEASPRDHMANLLRDCRDFARHFGTQSPSLLLFGNAGLGKTHLALSIANAILEKGYDVIYVSAQSAFAEVSGNRFERNDTLFTAMLRSDLLVLDDLGTEYVDAYVLSKLYELVNTRADRPTIYTTNIVSQDLLYQRYTEKIASRLLGGCIRMRFLGNDLRLSAR